MLTSFTLHNHNWQRSQQSECKVCACSTLENSVTESVLKIPPHLHPSPASPSCMNELESGGEKKTCVEVVGVNSDLEEQSMIPTTKQQVVAATSGTSYCMIITV